MFLIYHGENSYAIDAAVADLRQKVGPPDLVEANSHRFDGSGTRFAEIQAACEAMPFLAEHRLVVVEGLLSLFEPRGDRRRGRDGPSARLVEEWSRLGEMADNMPPTTLLVLPGGKLRPGNALLRKLRSHAEVKEFKNLPRNDLARWMKDKVAESGSRITPGALTLLSQWVGGDQRVLSSELEKLSLYTGSRPIAEDDVRALVSQIKEANIFAAVDALIEGRLTAGVQMVQRLRADGVSFPQIVARLADQIRRVLLAKEILDGGGGQAEVRERLNISYDFIVRQAVQQAGRLSRMRLESLYGNLLEADLSVKRGQLDEDLALDVLLSRFSRPVGPRRS